MTNIIEAIKRHKRKNRYNNIISLLTAKAAKKDEKKVSIKLIELKESLRRAKMHAIL